MYCYIAILYILLYCYISEYVNTRVSHTEEPQVDADGESSNCWNRKTVLKTKLLLNLRNCGTGRKIANLMVEFGSLSCWSGRKCSFCLRKWKFNKESTLSSDSGCQWLLRWSQSKHSGVIDSKSAQRWCCRIIHTLLTFQGKVKQINEKQLSNSIAVIWQLLLLKILTFEFLLSPSNWVVLRFLCRRFVSKFGSEDGGSIPGHLGTSNKKTFLGNCKRG